MDERLCHHLFSQKAAAFTWNVLKHVLSNSPNRERSIMKFLCPWNSLELEFILQDVLSCHDYLDVRGRWRRQEKAEQNQRLKPEFGFHFAVWIQMLWGGVQHILQSALTKQRVPMTDLVHTCKRFISSGFSEPGTFSFNIDDMTLTFIFAISSSLYSFPICSVQHDRTLCRWTEWAE